MALQKCHECGKDVSTAAKLCPTCGAPVKHELPQGFLKSILIIIVCLIAMSLFGQVFDSCDKRKIEKEQAQKAQVAAQEEEQRKDSFIKDIENKYQNLLGLIKERKNDDAYKALALFKKYNQLGYKDVREIDKKVSIVVLEKTIKDNKPGNHYSNMSVYKKLSVLDPENKKYKKEYEFYKLKVDERARKEREKERREQEARQKRLVDFGDPPENSSWDGSVACVERYLKSVAKDPDSLVFEKWGTVTYNDKDGWLVWCDFRGKNSFGGYSRDTKWFVIRHNTVVAVKPFNAYR